MPGRINQNQLSLLASVPHCCSTSQLLHWEHFPKTNFSNHNMAPTPMDFFDLANLLDNDGNLQNEMMVASFAATMLATIPVLLGNEFDVNVGLKKRKKREEREEEAGEKMGGIGEMGGKKSEQAFRPPLFRQSTKFSSNPL